MDSPARDKRGGLAGGKKQIPRANGALGTTSGWVSGRREARLALLWRACSWGPIGEGEGGTAEHAGGMLDEGDVEGGAGEEAGGEDG